MNRVTAWKRILIAALLLASASSPAAFAEETSNQAMVAAALKILPPLVLAPALVEACSAREPAKHDFYAGMLIAWRRHNKADAYDRSIANLIAGSPSAASLMTTVKTKAGNTANLMVGKSAETCSQLPHLLVGPDLTLGDSAAAAKAVIDAGLGGAAVAPATPAGPLTLYSVGQMSALVQTTIATSAKTNDGLKAATKLLAGLGPVAVTGQVVPGNHALRDIEAERQSIMRVVCFSYDQPRGEEALTALGGQQVVLSGMISEVWSLANMRMDKCHILDGTAGLAKAGVNDQAGFEMRPPTAAEAQAGANQGIALTDVADVLYQFSTAFHMDGFGNGSMDRLEDTYVLFKDGIAYRHDWSFPFQDLNLALVKRRQPDNWFQWRRSGSDFVLTRVSGRSRGESITLNANTELRPLPAGTAFSHDYFFLDVGRAGLTRNRLYRFGADGSLTVDRSSLVAAKTAPGAAGVSASTPNTSFTGGGLQNGFVASAGTSGTESLRYRIDGYVIEFIHADGRIERQSIGLMAGEPLPPENLYLGGQTLWSKKD